MDTAETQQCLCKLVEAKYAATVQHYKPIGEGSAGKVYQFTINKPPYTLCIKQYKTAALNEQQAYEMAYLGRYSTIKFPEVYFVHNATPEYPVNCMAMEVIAGESAMNRKFFWYPKKKGSIAQSWWLKACCKYIAKKTQGLGC